MMKYYVNELYINIIDTNKKLTYHYTFYIITKLYLKKNHTHQCYNTFAIINQILQSPIIIINYKHQL